MTRLNLAEVVARSLNENATHGKQRKSSVHLPGGNWNCLDNSQAVAWKEVPKQMLLKKSERQDLNLRSLHPQCSA